MADDPKGGRSPTFPLSGTRVLVTGAGGFIGSHLTEALARAGCQVRAMVHYSALGGRGWLDSVAADDRIEILAGDITDPERTAAVVDGCDVVFHLAALIAIPYSYQAPRSYFRTNVEGTLNVLEAARRHGVRRVIHTSTSEVYGSARYVPIDEAHPLQGQSPYSASKIGADKLVEAFVATHGMPVVTVRPFNTFGPRQSARAVIPTLAAQMLAGGPVRLGNLTPTRDFTFVDDTVAGFVAAAEADDGVCGETVNLGTGNEISIRELAELLSEITGTPCTITTEEARMRPAASEVDRLCSNPAKAGRLFGWSAATTLREGLQRTVDWISDHAGAAYRPDVYHV